jgi:hypothetical protein
MAAAAEPQVEDDVQAWLNREIAEGRLSAAPSPEVSARIAAMLIGPVAQPHIKRAHRRLARAKAQAPASSVDGLEVIEEIEPPKPKRKSAAPSP